MIFIVSGPGGVGKGTLVSRLVESDSSLWLSRSWTTRPQREGESPTAYEFVDTKSFLRRADEGGFLEWVEFLGHHYGTPMPDASGADGDIILEIELQGAQKVKVTHPEAVLILIAPPSTEEQIARLRSRGEGEARIAERVEVGRREMAIGSEIADETVINDDLESALASLRDIVDRYRQAEHS
jgi:guanylate kinase